MTLSKREDEPRVATAPSGVSAKHFPACLRPRRCCAVVVVVVVLIGSVSVTVGEEGGPIRPVVHTLKGKVQGVKELSEKGRPFLSFYAIPFARPPVQHLRFQDPVEEEAWTGVRDASSQPSPCVQYSFIDAKQRSISPEDVSGSEDCLYLNVFTPEVGVDHGSPVMVFLHGGGYVGGAARQFLPNVLLDHQVVLVVPQFRLGALGFLSTEDEVMPGNYMLKDQVKALQWVQRNIRRFGGDPERVTLFGESAGGSSTHLLLLSPWAQGLFSRVILQSGNALSPFALGGRLKEVTEETAYSLGCQRSSDSRGVLSFLQTVPATSLAIVPAKYYEFFVLPTLTAPRVDGDFLPADPVHLLSHATFPPVDLITGFTSHDGALLTLPLYHLDTLMSGLQERFTETGPLSLVVDDVKVATAIFEHYLGGTNVDLEHSEYVTQLFTEHSFGVPSDLVALTHARSSHRNTFAFELTHRGEHSMADAMNVTVGKHWVTHADDLLYLFPFRPVTRPEDLALRDIMTTLWVNFAATGNPTPDDSLGFTWEAVEENALRYLALSPSPAMQPDSRQQTREFFRSVLPKQNRLYRPQQGHLEL